MIREKVCAVDEHHRDTDQAEYCDRRRNERRSERDEQAERGHHRGQSPQNHSSALGRNAKREEPMMNVARICPRYRDVTKPPPHDCKRAVHQRNEQRNQRQKDERRAG